MILLGKKPSLCFNQMAPLPLYIPCMKTKDENPYNFENFPRTLGTIEDQAILERLIEIMLTIGTQKNDIEGVQNEKSLPRRNRHSKNS